MQVSYSAKQALAYARANPHRAWLGTAKERLTSGAYFPAGISPRITFGKQTRIFTMGSCFAREVENALQAIKAHVLLAGHGVPRRRYESWKEDDASDPGDKLNRGAFNKYSVQSMAHELRRVVLGESLGNDGLIEVGKDKWFDPHATRLAPADLETARDSRRRIDAGNRTILDADAVFLTMGLTETWVDQETGQAINTPPPPAFLARHGERFRFVDYSYEETLEEMAGLLELLKSKLSPDLKVIVTVSPVPLGSTFKEQDVVIANTASKAKLRTVADALYRRFDFVDYFPSYEIVTNSPRSLAWMDDQIHVNPRMVGFVMEQFQSNYMTA